MGTRQKDKYDPYPFPKLPSLSHNVLVYLQMSLLLSLSPSYPVMPCDTSPEILGDNVSAKHNDILFELLLCPHNIILQNLPCGLPQGILKLKPKSKSKNKGFI